MADMARWGPVPAAAGIRVTNQRLLVLDVLAAHRLCGPARHHHLVCRVCGMVAERQV
ncbi:hypothetical protein ACFPOI_29360 [Nonomuraea angiospora]|uniref:Fe2+ or Zn2+ uptake regulation protein n=1 Tax=Nonomuraea angiospora TaxID=46172 RepID=A0ABR9LU60_9ACTN|nr:hypothetical protein [Nonomuraea angiospora]MBE1584177.1 Fe2+ or Zn2+ uptake regulation protein [Nonomuraea angiospora]